MMHREMDYQMDKAMTSDAGDRSTVGDMNDRLKRIENQVELLLERQRISRFDNLMLLLYPIVTLGLTLLANAALRYGMVPRNSLVGIAESIMFFIAYYGGILLVLGMVLPFIQFIRAYALDDLRGRLTACGTLPFFPISLLGIMAMMPYPSWVPILWLVAKGAEPLLGVLLFTSIFLCIIAFAIGFGMWIECRLISWFETNAPLAFAATKSVRLKRGRLVAFSGYRAVVENDMRGPFFASKILWCTFCLFYAVLVAGAVRVSGQFEFLTYYVVFLMTLIILTVIVISGKVRSFLI